MFTFQECQDIINKAFKNIDLKKEPVNLYQPIEYILSMEGKRIRPALVLMACNLFSDNIEQAIFPAIGLEIFHNFTLVHDDIMDNSPIRRNQTTIHKKWNNNIAILSGDAMCIIAYEYLLKGVHENKIKILNEFVKTAIQVCEGQQYDMDFEDINDVTIDEYINMIRLKTSVLLASCLRIGAIIGDASENDSEYLYQYGKDIGIAFQLQDDLLDVFADIKKFGKKIGNDIVTKKKTFLLIKAFELANESDYKRLKFIIENKKLDNQTKIEEVKAIYEKLGIQDITSNKISEYINSANNYLNKVSVDQEKKYELIKFSKMLLNRKF